MPGEDEDLIHTGGSAVIAPDSSYVAGPVFDEPCILYAEIEPDRIVEGHMLVDTDGHYARPDVFHLEVNDGLQLNVSFRSQAERER